MSRFERRICDYRLIEAKTQSWYNLLKIRVKERSSGEYEIPVIRALEEIGTSRHQHLVSPHLSKK